jgi:NADPH2:quinone reductase
MTTYRAFRLYRDATGPRAAMETLPLPEPAAGEVRLRVLYSGINYKDALAGTGAAPIARKSPLTGGIDVAGVVDASASPAFAVGEAVFACGSGLSEVLDGGYGEYALLPAGVLMHIPPTLDAYRVMAIGTAGFTATQAILRLEAAGLTPGAGPVLVTGATGGVGSFACDLLAGRGYQVVALTGKGARAREYLKTLGVVESLPRDTDMLGSGPLAVARWAACIDNVAGDLLPRCLASLLPGGAVAAVGLAGGATFTATVYPFLLRGVALLGIDSVGCPAVERERIWARLGTDLRPRHLQGIVTREVPLSEIAAALPEYLAGGIMGRTVVRVAP